MTHLPDRTPPNDSEEIVDGDVTWHFDRAFLTSNWTCIWGHGCKGILDVPAEDLNQGCCSIGAELTDTDEAMTISALAATVDDDLFQHRSAIDDDDVFSDSTRTNTKVVDGACIFLNRPGFAGGEGCALHIAALRAGDSPTMWKPAVCWQLPIKVDWEQSLDGSEIATLRGWARRDWGADGVSMHWCCTEGPEAYVGDRMVVD
ncbi:MAG TPA: hypothetical protein VGC84_16385, partial [Ilumatobacteraceae bacterium]